MEKQLKDIVALTRLPGCSCFQSLSGDAARDQNPTLSAVDTDLNELTVKLEDGTIEMFDGRVFRRLLAVAEAAARMLCGRLPTSRRQT